MLKKCCFKTRALLDSRRMKKTLQLLLIVIVLFVFTSFGQETNQANTAIIPEPRSTNWVTRHEGFVQEAKTEQIDLLFLGDSITDFWRGKAPRYGINVWNKYYVP